MSSNEWLDSSPHHCRQHSSIPCAEAFPIDSLDQIDLDVEELSRADNNQTVQLQTISEEYLNLCPSIPADVIDTERVFASLSENVEKEKAASKGYIAQAQQNAFNERFTPTSNLVKKPPVISPTANTSPNVQLLNSSEIKATALSPSNKDILTSSDIRGLSNPNQCSDALNSGFPLTGENLITQKSADIERAAIFEFCGIDTPDESEDEEKDTIESSSTPTTLSSLGEAILSGVDDVFPGENENVIENTSCIADDNLRPAEKKVLFGKALKQELWCKVKLHQELQMGFSSPPSSDSTVFHTHTHVDDPIEIEMKRKARNREHAKRSREKTKAQRKSLLQMYTDLKEKCKTLKRTTKLMNSHVKTMNTWLESHQTCVVHGLGQNTSVATRLIDPIIEELDSYPPGRLWWEPHASDYEETSQKHVPNHAAHQRMQLPITLQRSISIPCTFQNKSQKSHYVDLFEAVSMSHDNEEGTENRKHIVASHHGQHTNVRVIPSRRRTKSEPTKYSDRWHSEPSKELTQTIGTPVIASSPQCNNGVAAKNENSERSIRYLYSSNNEVKMKRLLEEKKHPDIQVEINQGEPSFLDHPSKRKYVGRSFAHKKGTSLTSILSEPPAFQSIHQSIPSVQSKQDSSHLSQCEYVAESKAPCSPSHLDTSSNLEWITSVDAFASGDLEQANRSPWEVTGEHNDNQCLSPSTSLSPRMFTLDISSSSPSSESQSTLSEDFRSRTFFG